MPSRFGSVGTKRSKVKGGAKAQRPRHGDGYVEPIHTMRIGVRHSGDEYAVAVATRVQAHLPGSILSQSDHVDDGESNCRVLVGGKAIASVFWLRSQRRNAQWVEMMAKRLTQTVADAFPESGIPGFGAPTSLYRLRDDHGMGLDWSELNDHVSDGSTDQDEAKFIPERGAPLNDEVVTP